jgi:hypothetical protein
LALTIYTILFLAPSKLFALPALSRVISRFIFFSPLALSILFYMCSLGNPKEAAIKTRFDEFLQLRATFMAATTGHQLQDSSTMKPTNPMSLLEDRFDKLLCLDLGRLSEKERKAIERQIVSWQPDDAVHACYICHEQFSYLLPRKHHCRLCGRIICHHCLIALNPLLDYPTPMPSYYTSQSDPELLTTFKEEEPLKSIPAIRSCLACYQALSFKLVDEKIYRPFFELYQRFFHEFILLKNLLLLYPDNLFMLQHDRPNRSASPAALSKYTELFDLSINLKTQIVNEFSQTDILLAQIEHTFLYPHTLLNQNSQKATNLPSSSYGAYSFQLQNFKKMIDRILDFYKRTLKLQKITFKTLPPLHALSPHTVSDEDVQRISLPDLSLGKLIQSSLDDPITSLKASNNETMSEEFNLSRLIPGSKFFSSLLGSPSREPLDPEYRSLLIEQRIQLYETLQDALRNDLSDRIQPLEAAIEEIDTLLRREFL